MTPGGQLVHPQRHYNSYMPKKKATIRKFVAGNGVMGAKRKFSTKLKLNISENTVQLFKQAYLEERHRKREVEDTDSEVE